MDVDHAVDKLTGGFNLVFAKALLKIGEVDVNPEIGFVDQLDDFEGLSGASEQTTTVFGTNFDAFIGRHLGDFGHAGCNTPENIVQISLFRWA